MQIHPLRRGSTAGIVVPARTVDTALLLAGKEVIESWGLNVRLGEHYQSTSQSYLAAADEHRLTDLQSMLDDPTIDVIFCARGGYGTTRILDQLNFEKFLLNPKWIIGFSDITALHLKVCSLGIESIHACMPVQYSKKEYEESLESLRNLLFEKAGELKADFSPYNRLGVSRGNVTGGNLSLIVDSLATSTEPDTDGKILIIEEVGEPLYKIDRMLTHLKRATKLQKLAGLVVGHFTDISDTELPFNSTVPEMILEKVREYGYPIAFNFPIGHEAPNLAWRHGANGTLRVENEGSILFF